MNEYLIIPHKSIVHPETRETIIQEGTVLALDTFGRAVEMFGVDHMNCTLFRDYEAVVDQYEAAKDRLGSEPDDDTPEFVEVEEIQPIVNNMHRILFSTRTLTHDDRRDLENLLALLEQRIKGE